MIEVSSCLELKLEVVKNIKKGLSYTDEKLGDLVESRRCRVLVCSAQYHS